MITILSQRKTCDSKAIVMSKSVFHDHLWVQCLRSKFAFA